MTHRRFRLTAPLAIAILVLAAGAFLAVDSPAKAQCMSPSECDALEQQLKDVRQDLRAAKQEIRELVRQARALPRGSAERQELKERIRGLRRSAKDERRAARPLRQSYRSGCRNC